MPEAPLSFWLTSYKFPSLVVSKVSASKFPHTHTTSPSYTYYSTMTILQTPTQSLVGSLAIQHKEAAAQNSFSLH